MSGNYLFNEVTGQSDYERQSWRDSYNGGRAAGDITGNVNRELDRERDAFQGATWSGSSSQYSALEVAQRAGGVGHPAAASGVGASKSSGPGNETVRQGPNEQGRPAGGSGAGSKLTISGAPLKASTKDTATGGYAGVHFLPNPWFSDVQEWWEPRAGEPGEWLGGIVTIGADAVFNAGRAVDWAAGTRMTDPGRKGGSVLQDAQNKPGAWPGIGDAIVDWDTGLSRRLHDTFVTDRPFVGGGF